MKDPGEGLTAVYTKWGLLVFWCEMFDFWLHSTRSQQHPVNSSMC